MTGPLTPAEERLYREGLEHIPDTGPGLSGFEAERRMWAGRVRRVFATLDAERVTEAWEVAVAACPDGFLGPRVEPRWPDRWRAWYESVAGDVQRSAFGPTEAAALRELAIVVVP